MASIPFEKIPDSTLALIRDPYRFISDGCRRHQSDLFETRLLLQRTICMTGPEAARLFYDPTFSRARAQCRKQSRRRCSGRVACRASMEGRTATASTCSCR